jgi:hypothetical protein
MNTIRLTIGSLLVLMVCTGFICEDDSPSGSGGSLDVLFASSSNVTVLNGTRSKVVISNGTSPYSIVQNSNSAVATASLNGAELQIDGLTTGATTITVQDGSTPAKSVSITATVVTSVTLTSSGSLSFSSPSGNFSASGILSLSQDTPPTSGQAAGALQKFGSTSVVAYRVNSPTNIEVVEMDLIYATSLVTGTYSYPSGGNTIQLIYAKNINPQNSSETAKVYAFLTASATVTSVTATTISGTFSGTGTNIVSSSTTDVMTVTNGTFSVPIKDMGGNEEHSIERMAQRVREKYLQR